MKTHYKLTVVLAFTLLTLSSKAAIFITVAADGSGDYKTIGGAINALPMFNYERAVIFIKNGVYNEKIRIDQDYITLRGESREKTIIQYSQLRTDWIAHKDSLGAAVVNINGDDIVLENLTIENSQPKVGPHAFTIYGTGTRTILFNCSVLSKGGDTVSLWDYKNGMYYHSNCTFVGAVDFVCPRGWCFIRNSKFYELMKTASIWHAGGYDKDQKLVIWNSTFDGIRGFELGRHHYDSQFYLLYCTFTDSMANKPIYRVTVSKVPSENRPFTWGERYYFYECHGAHVDYDWHKNNLDNAQKRMRPEDLTSTWTFEGRWDPESKEGPKIVDYVIKDTKLLLTFSEPITLKGLPTIKSRSGRTYNYNSGGGSSTLMFDCDTKIYKDDVKGLKFVNDGRFLGTTASVAERVADLTIK
jgi:pectinesterase